MFRSLAVLLLASVFVGQIAVTAQEPQTPSGTAPSPAPVNPPSANPNPATAVYPLDAVASADGTIYVVDRNLPGVWQIKEGKVSVFAQGSKKFREPLNAVRCIALDSNGAVLVGDSGSREVYRLDANGKPEGITGGKIGIPVDLAVAADGTIYVADLETRHLLKIAPGTKEPVKVAAVNARGVFVDSNQGVWVVSQDAQQIQQISADGKSTSVVSERVFDFPHQIVVTASGDAFVSDGYGKTIWKIVKGGKPEVLAKGEPLVNPVGLFLVQDQVHVVDPRASAIFKLGADNKLELMVKIAKE